MADMRQKLDPSLYLTETDDEKIPESDKMTISSGANSRTMLRRRTTASSNPQKQQQMNNPNYHQQTIIPLDSATFLPKEEENGLMANHEKQARPPTPALGETQGGGGEGGTRQTRDKIFSITTSLLLIMSIISLISVFCFCTINGSSLLVSAHHSTKDQQAGSGGVKSPPLLDATSQAVPRSQAAGSSSGVVDSNQKQVGPRSVDHSIDRFDEGEQIRPPLLRRPTTLPPLQRRSGTVHQGRVSGDERLNLQAAAATQDSYLSPEDREQFMRHQESHYEGKNSPEGNMISGQPSSDQLSSTGSDGYEGPVNQARLSNSESVSNNLRGPPIDDQSANADADDGDYEEEAPEPKRGQANLVPENRRMAAGAPANYQQQLPHRNQQIMRPTVDSSNNDEGDPGDDGTGDDVYFNRKSSNNLNLAASYNQQNRNAASMPIQQYNLHQQQAGGYNEGPRDNGGNIEEGPGFGPGPNEAYLVDRAESGKMGVDAEDEGLYPAGSNNDADGGGDDDGGKFDRRSMNEAGPEAGGGIYNPINSDNIDPESDADEPSDPPEESASSHTPSQQIDTATANALPRQTPDRYADPGAYPKSQSPASPKTSASAPAPQSALPNQRSPHQRRDFARPEPATIPPMRSMMAREAGQMQVIPMTSSKAPPGSGDSQFNRQQYKATQVPYNPQLNPSHAGKYFID